MQPNPIIYRLRNTRCLSVPLSGKTITAACKTSPTVWLLFDDGTWFASNASCDEHQMLLLENYDRDFAIDEHPLVVLGLITEDEFRECDKWLRENSVAVEKEYRRREFERLKKEFEPDACE